MLKIENSILFSAFISAIGIGWLATFLFDDKNVKLDCYNSQQENNIN